MSATPVLEGAVVEWGRGRVERATGKGGDNIGGGGVGGERGPVDKATGWEPHCHLTCPIRGCGLKKPALPRGYNARQPDCAMNEGLAGAPS